VNDRIDRFIAITTTKNKNDRLDRFIETEANNRLGRFIASTSPQLYHRGNGCRRSPGVATTTATSPQFYRGKAQECNDEARREREAQECEAQECNGHEAICLHYLEEPTTRQ
jgi:hypothetical protein